MRSRAPSLRIHVQIVGVSTPLSDEFSLRAARTLGAADSLCQCCDGKKGARAQTRRLACEAHSRLLCSDSFMFPSVRAGSRSSVFKGWRRGSRVFQLVFMGAPWGVVACRSRSRYCPRPVAGTPSSLVSADAAACVASRGRPARAQTRSIAAGARPADGRMASQEAQRGVSNFSESAALEWVSETRAELQRRSGAAASASSSAGAARWAEAALFHARHDPAPPAPSSSSSSAALGPASITRPPLQEQGSFEDECDRWRHVLFDLATSPANFMPARNSVYICGRPVQVRLPSCARGD